ncbi:SMP-30/gluconolactonase/LRE family protein [Mycobacterium sp. TY814]|uniref:SMP-30/gluconolactonase/LRE family protein n=1 Tax=unclassified Mycobacterium TaxID=2642494 RepID=UPI0027416C8C|nr:SMP-30/gluconolactonase/LRE family protein [Mycobacterium sp. TY814]MDP7725876.1 SMP-30/gluconolactonase/LRE family protein [Mycobacterium sp. TY814]
MTEVLWESEGLLEAPRPLPDGSVLFANTTAGGVYRWSDGGVSTVLEKRRGIGGIAVHADGGLLVSGRDLAYTGPAGPRTVWAADGATGLNDLTVAPDGSVVVGVLRHQRGETAGPTELVQLSPDGTATVLVSDLLWPNGVGYAPDGTRLYVCEYAAARVRGIGPQGAAVFAAAPRGECDGLAVDVEGGVWVALGSGCGIARFDATGGLDHIVDMPGRFVSSLAFAGTEIYVTTIGALLRIDVGVRGSPTPVAAIPLG